MFKISFARPGVKVGDYLCRKPVPRIRLVTEANKIELANHRELHSQLKLLDVTLRSPSTEWIFSSRRSSDVTAKAEGTRPKGSELSRKIAQRTVLPENRQFLLFVGSRF